MIYYDNNTTHNILLEWSHTQIEFKKIYGIPHDF